MKLRRSFASFALVLLLFSVSLAPCFIDKAEAATAVSDMAEYVCDIYPLLSGTTSQGWESFNVPCDDKIGLYATNFSHTSTTPYFGLNFYSNAFESKDFDRTLIFTISPVVYSGNGSVHYSWNGGNITDLKWKTDKTDANTIYTLTGGVTVYGALRNETNLASYSAPYTFYVTVPATANYFEFNANNTVNWSVIVSSGTVNWNFDCFGAYVLNTADSDIVSLVQRILAQLQDTDTDIENIGQTLATVVNQLISLNSDTDTIISLLQSLEGLSTNQLAQLEKISSSVDAIYYFLTEDLKDEADDMSQAAQDAAGHIDNSHVAEEYWQTSMQGNYDSLDLENFTFGGVTSGIELVGRIFQDMFNAFGSYKILFTFPLTLGISLLVIGRLSKFGGGNSSRNKEHKGGEGGA